MHIHIHIFSYKVVPGARVVSLHPSTIPLHIYIRSVYLYIYTYRADSSIYIHASVYLCIPLFASLYIYTERCTR